MTKYKDPRRRAPTIAHPRSAAPPGTAYEHGARIPGEVVRTTSYDLLDYFAKCPRCGYAAQASETVRAYSSGLVERGLYRTCGLPCGWHDSTFEVADTVSAAALPAT
ncbi:hypothetical protein [Nocardia sp. NPDC059195]|uniref:hypothetical protein n=1 Tax=Nocardia sp. NPDC059195 TaxID=3346765 RepID=UPI0036AA9509